MAIAHLTEKQHKAYVALLTRELRQPHLGWILDDAVTGAGVYFDILEDYGLSPDNLYARQALLDAIAAALREGY